MSKMNNYNKISQLKKPVTQILNLLTLLFIGFSCITYCYGLTLNETPMYLIVTTLFCLSVAVLGLLQFINVKTKQTYDVKKIYLGIGILSAYTTLLSFYNIYFFMGAEQGFNLTKYWIVGFCTLLICATAHLLSLVLMIYTPKWINNKKIMIMILKGIALLFYFQKIIEYFVIPNISESNFIFILIMIMMFGSNLIVSQFIVLYGEFLHLKNGKQKG